MLRAILNKSWGQHPTKQQLYSHLPPVTKTIEIWRTRHAEHYWRSRDELVSEVLLKTPSQGRAKAGRPARTYILQLCADTSCSSEDLPKAMDYREGWRERVRNIRANSATWWGQWQFSIIRRTPLSREETYSSSGYTVRSPMDLCIVEITIYQYCKYSQSMQLCGT